MSEQAPQAPINVPVTFEGEPLYDAELLKQRGQQQNEQHVYDTNRPFQDEKGRMHDPANGQLANIDAYFDKQRAIAEDSTQDPYESMTMTQLARKLGEAEFHGDKTSSINVSDVLMDKLSEYESKVVDGHDASQKTGERHDTDHNNTFSDNMWDRVMGVKDKEIARLKEESQAKPAPNPEKPENDAPKDEATESDTATEAETAESEEDIRIKTATAEAKEAMENQPGMRILTYKPNAEGMAETATEFTAKGLQFDLADLSDKCIIFNTEDSEEFPGMAYYVEDDEVYNLSHMAKLGKEEGGWSVEQMNGQTKLEIGESIVINGVTVSGAVKKLMIEMPAMHVDEHAEEWEALDEVSPFQLAGDLIDKVQAAEKADWEPATPLVKQEGNVLMQERPKQVMGWAARQLKRIKNVIPAAAAYASNAVSRTKEYFTDEDRGKRRGIIGATAGAILLAGVAYLELKGVNGSREVVADRSPGGVDGGSSMIDVLPDSDTSGPESTQETVSYDEPEATSEAASTAVEKTQVVTLRHGDTVSHIALDQLQKDNLPTDQAHILARTQQILDLNHISWEEARHLADDTKIKV